MVVTSGTNPAEQSPAAADVAVVAVAAAMPPNGDNDGDDASNSDGDGEGSELHLHIADAGNKSGDSARRRVAVEPTHGLPPEDPEEPPEAGSLGSELSAGTSAFGLLLPCVSLVPLSALLSESTLTEWLARKRLATAMMNCEAEPDANLS